MSKSALILFPHGLGDVIMATPSLEAIANEGYEIDMMVRPSVVTSHLLDDCPFIRDLIKARTDTTEFGFNKYHMPRFRALGKEYDRTEVSRLHDRCVYRHRLIAEELHAKTSGYDYKVWIPDECKQEAEHFLANRAPEGDFVYVHTKTEVHRHYWWDSLGYVKKTFGDLPIVDSGYEGEDWMRFDNINTNFALIEMAKHRVMSLSVMAAAAEALKAPMDVLNIVDFGHSCRPADRNMVSKLRVSGVIR